MQEKNNKALLTLLFIGVLMGALDLAIIGPALPAIQEEFRINDRLLSVLFNAYILCQLVGTPLLAKLADRFGSRKIYIFSIGCFALGSLFLVVAESFTTLAFGRAIQGFGAGGIFPVAAAVIGARLPAEKRGPALGLIGVVFGLAFLIGPILGGILLRFAWQWLFIINLPIAAVLIFGATRLLTDAKRENRAPFDLAGAIVLTGMLTALVIGLNNVNTVALLDSLNDVLVGPFLLGFVLCLPLFWYVEKRATDPIIRPEFFGSKQISMTCIIAFGVGAIQSGSVFYPALAVAALGVSKSDAAWLMLPGVIAATIGSPVAGRLINSIGTQRVVIAGLLLVATSIVIYALTDLVIMTFILAGTISGAGMSALLGAARRATTPDPAERIRAARSRRCARTIECLHVDRPIGRRRERRRGRGFTRRWNDRLPGRIHVDGRAGRSIGHRCAGAQIAIRRAKWNGSRRGGRLKIHTRSEPRRTAISIKNFHTTVPPWSVDR